MFIYYCLVNSKGASLERLFKEYFKLWGFECIKAGGSLGTDLMAAKKGIPVLIISVKWLRKYFRPKDREETLQTTEKTGGIAILAYKHIPKGKTRGICTIEIIKQRDEKGSFILLKPLKKCSKTCFDEWIKSFSS